MSSKDPWSLLPRTEKQYERDLVSFYKQVQTTVEGLTTIAEIVAAVEAISKMDWFQAYAHRTAHNMVKSVLVENAQTWREAARKGQRSYEIHRILKAEFSHNAKFLDIIEQNATVIKTLPQTLATSISQKAATEAIAGRRTGEIVQSLLSDAPNLARWQAQRIARTEIAKTQSAITQIRCQEIGINWFTWQTSQDQRVRSSHKHMQGVICAYTDLPDPEKLDHKKSQFGVYGPGTVPNCRCYASPVVDVDFIEWPKKVCKQGDIKLLGKKKFLDIQ